MKVDSYDVISVFLKRRHLIDISPPLIPNLSQHKNASHVAYVDIGKKTRLFREQLDGGVGVDVHGAARNEEFRNGAIGAGHRYLMKYT